MGNTHICKQCESIQTNYEIKPNTRTPSRQHITLSSPKQKEIKYPIIEPINQQETRVTYERAEVYLGQFINNMKHGIGKLTWPNGAEYQGNWKNDLACGQGIFKQGNVVYEGQFANNEPIRGKFSSGNLKEQYEGEFKNHKFEGSGRLIKIGLYTYEGHFKNNMKDGKGRIIFSSGDQFEGQFVCGKFQGYGVFKSITHKYQGLFKNGEYHGQGRYTWASGNVYEGNYQNGQKNGYGIYHGIDGSKYKGNWYKGKRHGQGIQMYPHGEQQKVVFNIGLRVDKVI